MEGRTIPSFSRLIMVLGHKYRIALCAPPKSTHRSKNKNQGASTRTRNLNKNKIEKTQEKKTGKKKRFFFSSSFLHVPDEIEEGKKPVGRGKGESRGDFSWSPSLGIRRVRSPRSQGQEEADGCSERTANMVRFRANVLRAPTGVCWNDCVAVFIRVY